MKVIIVTGFSVIQVTAPDMNQCFKSDLIRIRKCGWQLRRQENGRKSSTHVFVNIKESGHHGILDLI